MRELTLHFVQPSRLCLWPHDLIAAYGHKIKFKLYTSEGKDLKKKGVRSVQNLLFLKLRLFPNSIPVPNLICFHDNEISGQVVKVELEDPVSGSLRDAS